MLTRMQRNWNPHAQLVLMFNGAATMEKSLALPQKVKQSYHIMQASKVVLVVKNSCLFRRHRLNPRVGKIPWRRTWQPTPVFLLGESHGQRCLVGYSPWGCKESDTTEQLSMHVHTHLRCSNSTPRYIPKRTEDRHSHKNLHTIVRSSIMCNNLKWNRTSLMVQWIGVHLPCRGHRFDSWSRRIPHAMKLLSPRVTTTEPVLQNKGSHCNEKPMGWRVAPAHHN